jgi:O-acetyl-ADP-ribose deacetylase (regulator of RNase III)
MIELGTGDLLRADVDALVNTVNTEGVMGKGIALQFKQAFPENFKAYKRACDRGDVRPGQMFVFDQGGLDGGPRFIINFPTKRHWKSKSKLEDIEAGLRHLVVVIRERRIKSIAVPPLGCGNGGLRWSEVEPLIEAALQPLDDVRVLLFAPVGAPQSKTMRVGTARPRMTSGRAGLLGLMSRYGEPGTTFTKLELQKLAYFLQCAGEPLKLDFVRHQFGPYSEKLNHALLRMEGHFIRGYGDRSGLSEITPDPMSTEEAMAFLHEQPQTLERLERVARLFFGLESPHGAELLATIHWVVSENPELSSDLNGLIATVHQWSERKREKFPPRHIEIAWKRLRSEGWLPVSESAEHCS